MHILYKITHKADLSAYRGESEEDMSKAVKAHYVYQGGNIGQYYLCYAHCSNCGGYLLPKTEVCKTCGDKVKWTIPYHKNPGDSFED